MAGLDDFLASVPTFQQSIDLAQPAPPPPAGTPTGTGNFLTSGLGSGAYGLAASLGQGVEAGARAVGATSTADNLAAWAQTQRNTAATYANPQIEASPLLSPTHIGYMLAQGLPGMVGVLGGAALGAAAAPEVAGAGLIGGALAAFPGSVGENIERARQEGQPVDQGAALKALALGVPEAALQSILPAKGEAWLSRGIGEAAATGATRTWGDVARSAGRGALTGGAIQVPVAAAGEALMQQMGDPNREFAQRSQDIVNAALSGGIQGAFFGGVLHSLAKQPAATVTPDQTINAVDSVLRLPPPDSAGAPQLQAPQFFSGPRAGEQPEGVSQVPSGATVAAPDQSVHQGEPVETPLLAPPQKTAGAGAPEPLPGDQPTSGDAISTPTTLRQRLEGLSNNDLLSHVQQQGATSESGQAGLEVLADRLNWKAGDAAPTAEIIRQQLGDQDNAAAKQAVSDAQTAQIKQATRGFIPDFLKPHLGDEGALKGAIFDEATSRDQNNKPLGSRLTKIAKTFGILGDDGTLTDPRAQQEAEDTAKAQAQADQAQITKLPETEPAPEQGNPPPARVLKDDNWSQSRKDAWDKLEALRSSIPDNLTQFHTEISDLQSQLAKPGKGGISKIVSRAREMGKAVDAQGVVDKATGVEPTEAKAAEPASPVDETQGAKKFTAPEQPDFSGLSNKELSDQYAALHSDEVARRPLGAEIYARQRDGRWSRGESEALEPALSKQDQLKAKQKGAPDAVQERSPAQVGREEQPQAGGEAGAGDTAAQAPAREVQPPRSAQDASQAGKGEIAPEQTRNITKALTPLRKNIATLMERTPLKGRLTNEKSIAARNSDYQATLDALDRQQQAIGKAVKSGDLTALRAIKDDHFTSRLVDEHYDNMDLHTQGLIDKQSDMIDKVIDAVREATGRNHARSDDVLSSRVPTARDQSLAGLVDKGTTGRGLLEDIAKNGSNTIRRTIAARLLNMSKADPSVRFGSPEEAQREHPTLRNVYGDYHSGLDTMRIYDKADLEHTVLHEFAHAAMARAIDAIPSLKAAIRKLMDAAKSQMTPEEQAHPAMRDEHEFMSEGMVNSDFANLLDTMKPPRGVLGSIWQGFKDIVRGALGLPKNAETLLDHVEHLGGQAADALNHAATVQGMEHATGLYARTAQETAEQITRDLSRKYDLKGIDTNTYKKSLFWRNTDDFVAGISRWLPSGNRDVQNTRMLHNYTEAANGAVSQAYTLARSLDRRGQRTLNSLQAVNFDRIDPRRKVDEHVWLSKGEREALKSKIQAANELWRQANSGDKKVALAYEAMHNSNRAQMFSLLHNLGKAAIDRGGLKIKLDDAIGKFQDDTTGIKTDPRRAADYWQKALNDQLDVGRKYTSTVDSEISTTRDPEKRAALIAHITEYKDWERNVARNLTAAGQEPNFALRRDGDQFVAGKLRSDFNQGHIDQFYKMLGDQGFHDVVLSHNVDNNQVYIRTQGITSADALHKVFQAAEATGLIQKGSIDKGASAGLYKQQGVLPSYITAQMKAFEDTLPELSKEEAENDPDRAQAYAGMRKSALDQMRQQLLDILPESNTAKLFAKREYVQGAGSNFMRSFLERGVNASRGIANLAMSKDMADTMSAMRKEVDAAKRNGDLSVAQTNQIQAAANEIFLRKAQRQWKVEPSVTDWFKRATHLWELGFSVPYTMALQAQQVALGHPELTKHFGAVRSAQALAKANVQALQALRSTFTGADKFGFVMTPEKLKAGGIPDAVAQKLLHQDNMGSFNTSKTQWAYDGIHHGEGVMRKLHDVSGAWTLYSEMQPRLAQALAAYELYSEREAQGKAPKGQEWNDVHSFAKHMVDQSQFSWLPDLNPRAFGKQGAVGSASPLVAQFQLFRGKLLEKMHREFTDAFGARGDEYKTQARRYLLTHLAAQTMLAGTMGLPFVGMLAGVYDRLADWTTGDHTHDMKASYRGWLSNLFGNTGGEVLAHGVPRLGGIDVSEHLGEDRLLPFTEIAADKRKFQDAIKDQVFHMAGSAVHLGTKVVEGVQDFTNGDWLEGAAKVLPETFSNMAEGDLIGKYGYTDKAGFSYPGIKPGTKEVVETMLGIKPADEANYDEKKRIAQGLEERASFDTQNIQTHLAKGFNRQDPVAYARWMAASMNFMATHPGMMPPAGSFGNYLREHAQSAALAGALGTPLGVSPRDLLTRGMVSFGNAGDQ